MKAIFNFKVFGLAETEDGEPSFGYVQTDIKDTEGNICEILEEKYNDSLDEHRNTLAKILSKDIAEILPISQEEYEENTEE